MRKLLSQADQDAARRAAILARAALIPKHECHYCGTPIAPRALWCATEHATLYEAEKAELMGPK